MRAAGDKRTRERAIGAVHFPSFISFFDSEKHCIWFSFFSPPFHPSNLVCVTETSVPFHQGLTHSPQLL